MTVEHAGWKLIPWRPGVTEGMWSALVSLPKISILGSDVRLHGLADDLIAKVLELLIVVASLCSELGPDELGASLLDQLEEWVVLDASHLDDLSNTVTDPSLMEGLPEESVCEGKDWRMVGTVQILEAVTIAAGTW